MHVNGDDLNFFINLIKCIIGQYKPIVDVHHADNKWFGYSTSLASSEPWTLLTTINNLGEVSKGFISAQKQQIIRLHAEIGVSKW